MWTSSGSAGHCGSPVGRARVEDEQQVVVVGVELRPLAELARVLERHRMQAERLAEALDLLVGRARRGRARRTRRARAARAICGSSIDGEDVHGARPWQPRARGRRTTSARAAGASGRSGTTRRPRRAAVAIAAIVSPVPSASTKACSLAARTLPGAAADVPRPSRGASTSRSRAASGTSGATARGRGGRRRRPARRARRRRTCRRPCASSTACREATPAFVRSTAFIAAVLIGDIMKPMPRPSRTNGTTRKAKLVSTWIRDCQASETVDEQRGRSRAACAGRSRSASRPGERPGDHDHQRRGQEAHAGLQRRVAEDVLHVEREEEEHREHRRTRSRRRRGSRPGTSASGRTSKSTIGARERRSITPNATRPTTASTNRPMICGEPQPHALPSTSASTSAVRPIGQRRDAGVVDLARRGLVARLVRGEQRHDDRDDRDRDVDEEDRAPADVLGQPAAEQRAERQRDRRHAGPRADRLAALGGRERVGDDRQRRRASSARRRRPGSPARRRASPRSARSRSCAEAAAKMTTPIRKTLRRPKMSPRRPPVTSSTAKVSV